MNEILWDKDLSIELKPAKNGSSVPVLSQSGKSIPLASLYDPQSEGIKTSGRITETDVMIFSFSGGGFHIMPFVDNPLVKKIIIIDPEITGFASCSTKERNIILAHPKTSSIVLPHSPDFSIRLKKFLSVVINPHTDHSFCFFPFPSSALQNFHYSIKNLWNDFRTTLGSDLATQEEFGRLWLYNGLKNLLCSPNCSLDSLYHKKWIIAAAGPSLEKSLPFIKAGLQEGKVLASTDTAFPFLVQCGIRPHVVVTLDAQNYSCGHYIGIKTEEIILAADIFTSTSLVRSFRNHVLFFNNHPLCAYLETCGIAYPRWDTSGGNVTHSACILASLCGALSTEVYGADFACTSGKSHSRGTMYLTKAVRQSSRFLSAETQSLKYVFRNDTCKSTDRHTYETPLLLSYARQFESTFHAQKTKGMWFIPGSNSAVDSVRSKINQGFSFQKCKQDMLNGKMEIALTPYRSWQNKHSPDTDKIFYSFLDSLEKTGFSF